MKLVFYEACLLHKLVFHETCLLYIVFLHHFKQYIVPIT